MRYSVGDKVVIGAGRHGHGFNIGDTVEIFQVGNINYDCRGEGSRTWLIEDDEINHEATAKLTGDNKMKDMKFKIKNEAHSKAIQERLFELGYKWGGLEKKVIFTDTDYLFAENDGYITHADTDYANSDACSAYKETTLDELYAIDTKKTITIGGHECEIRKNGLYNKDVGLVSLQVMNIVDRATGVDTHSVVGEDVKIGVEYNFKVGCSTFTREDLKKAIKAVEDANS